LLWLLHINKQIRYENTRDGNYFFPYALGGIESQIKKGHIKANNNVEDIGKRLFIL